MKAKAPNKAAPTKKACDNVIFPDWHRLVDLHEQQIRALLAHGVSIETQKAAFEEALNRVVRSIIPGIAEVNAESWRKKASDRGSARSSKLVVHAIFARAGRHFHNPQRRQLISVAKGRKD